MKYLRKSKKKCTLIIGLSVEESKNIFNNLPKDFNSNQELIVFNYDNHSPDDGVHNINILRTDVNIDTYRNNIEKEFYDLCLKHKAKILHLFTRQMVNYNDLSYAEIEHLYFCTISNCIKWFDLYDIEFIFSRTVPQFAFEYLFFLYSSTKKIPFIYEYICPYAAVANFYKLDVHNLDFIFSKISTKSVKNNEIPVEHTVKSILDKISSAINNSDDSTRVSYYDMQNLFDKKMNSKFSKALWNAARIGAPEIVREIFYKDSVHFSRFNIQSSRDKKIPKRASALSIVKKSINSFLIGKRSLKKYKRLSKKCDLKTPAKTKVLYIAHQEPESVVLVEGGKITSNYEAIKYTQSIMPSDSVIYYKEHDANFYYYDLVDLGNAPENRPSNFYDLIGSEKNIHCIPIENNDRKKILEDVDVVVTLCGTFAIEASMYGVPVVVLSNPWYMESGVDNLIKPDQFSADLIKKEFYDMKRIYKQWSDFIYDTLRTGFYAMSYFDIDEQGNPNRFNEEYTSTLCDIVHSILIDKNKDIN